MTFRAYNPLWQATLIGLIFLTMVGSPVLPILIDGSVMIAHADTTTNTGSGVGATIYNVLTSCSGVGNYINPWCYVRSAF